MSQSRYIVRNTDYGYNPRAKKRMLFPVPWLEGMGIGVKIREGASLAARSERILSWPRSVFKRFLNDFFFLYIQLRSSVQIWQLKFNPLPTIQLF